MAIAQAKTSRARRDKRRSHHHLTIVASTKCSHCGHARLPHVVCPSCGWYKGRQVRPPREA